MWKEEDLISLINEGKAIQNRMTQKKKTKCDSDEKRFVKLMEQGKISAALRCIGSLQCGVRGASKQHKKKPSGLCKAVADLAKKLNTKEIYPSYLQALVSGRLIPLDKNPGVHPIGLGKVLRRTMQQYP